MQLDRLLQSQGWGSRKQCQQWIRAGRVTVGNEIVTRPTATFEPDGLRYAVDGEAAVWRASLYLLLHKPAGHECSREPQAHDSVFSLLPARFAARGVQPVGRLDQDTTGVLLLTDDGPLLHRISSPRHHVPKTYLVSCRHEIDDAQIDALLGGVVLRDDPAPVAAQQCERVDARRLTLVIGEGRYHQVKRMLAAVGNRVEALHRVAVGTVTLGDLAEGQWRELTADELAALRGTPG